MVMVEGVSLDQVAVPVTSCVEPSLKVAVALNCCVVPSGRAGFAGVTSTEIITAEVTDSALDPPTEPTLAVMFAIPWVTLLATPAEGPSLLIVATAGVSELHCTVPVMFCVLPSVKVPVAVNCCVVPRGMEGIAGVTAVETRNAGVTL